MYVIYLLRDRLVGCLGGMGILDPDGDNSHSRDTEHRKYGKSGCLRSLVRMRKYVILETDAGIIISMTGALISHSPFLKVQYHRDITTKPRKAPLISNRFHLQYNICNILQTSQTITSIYHHFLLHPSNLNHQPYLTSNYHFEPPPQICQLSTAQTTSHHAQDHHHPVLFHLSQSKCRQLFRNHALQQQHLR